MFAPVSARLSRPRLNACALGLGDAVAFASSAAKRPPRSGTPRPSPRLDSDGALPESGRPLRPRRACCASWHGTEFNTHCLKPLPLYHRALPPPNYRGRFRAEADASGARGEQNATVPPRCRGEADDAGPRAKRITRRRFERPRRRDEGNFARPAVAPCCRAADLTAARLDTFSGRAAIFGFHQHAHDGSRGAALATLKKRRYAADMPPASILSPASFGPAPYVELRCHALLKKPRRVNIDGHKLVMRGVVDIVITLICHFAFRFAQVCFAISESPCRIRSVPLAGDFRRISGRGSEAPAFPF